MGDPKAINYTTVINDLVAARNCGEKCEAIAPNDIENAAPAQDNTAPVTAISETADKITKAAVVQSAPAENVFTLDEDF